MRGRMTQDLFNKLVTVSMLLYAFVMISVSFGLQRPIDLSSYMTLLAPVLTHVVHILSNKWRDVGGSNGY
jgi:hypothetical protein